MLTIVSRSGKTSCWTRVPATNWPLAARRMSTRKGIVPRPCARRAKTTKDGWMCGYPPCGRIESKIPIRSVFLEVKPRWPSQRYSDFATVRITPALNCYPLCLFRPPPARKCSGARPKDLVHIPEYLGRFGQEVNPGLHETVALGLAVRIVRRQLLPAAFLGLRLMPWRLLTPRSPLALAAPIRSPGNWLACFTKAAN